MMKGRWQGIDYQGISIDTRSLLAGNLFIAIKGEQFDGHDYVEEAFKKGASGAVVARAIPKNFPHAVVQDPIQVLGELAHDWRQKFSLPLIALTGSSGKTTTKNMIAAVLKASQKPVLATQGNLNNHLGVPLTVANLDETHAYAVIEMGMNHFDEIRYITNIARPNIALITNAGPCHLEGVGGSIAGVAKAKAEIFEGLQEGGIAIINADDAFAGYWKESIKNSGKKIRVLTFGLDNPTADVSAQMISSDTFTTAGVNITLKLLGKHNVYNALSAIAVGMVNHIDLGLMKSALESLAPEKGRMQIKTGLNQVMLIDDTYNANPLSLKAAIKALDELSVSGKKILILGDMRELGVDAQKLHRECGVFAKENHIDILWAAGDLTLHTVDGFGENAKHFKSKEALIEALLETESQNQLMNKNNIILVKGSHSMQMDKVIDALTKHGE